jgi:hypothetical protein
MQPTLLDRLTPTAVGLVSRAWVLREVAAVPGLDAGARRRLVDVLIAYQPPRRQPIRDNAIAWAVLLGGAMLFNALDLPGWIGFLLALVALTAVARALATRALRWRLARWLQTRQDDEDAPPPS